MKALVSVGVSVALIGVAEISLVRLLDTLAGFDGSGGASLALAAWELCAEEHQLRDAWEQAIADGLLRPSGHNHVYGEDLWRLTAGGWEVLNKYRESG